MALVPCPEILDDMVIKDVETAVCDVLSLISVNVQFVVVVAPGEMIKSPL